jgi:YbbR domain-containing protein
MMLQRIFLSNLGLKITALVLAFFVWILITGKERSYIERTFDIDVEFVNVSQNIDIRYIRPESVKVEVRGTSNEVNSLSPDVFKLRVDLMGVNETTKLNFFTEDYLESPEGAPVVSIRPKMIEISVEEFLVKEVPVRVKYSKMFKPGVRLIERTVRPDKVRILGYKSQIQNIDMVSPVDSIDLSKIEETQTITLPLKKEEEILKFEDTDTVEVTIVVETRDGRD